MKIANEIFHMNFNNILKVKQKGKNKIGIDFSHYQAANNLLKNEKLLNKGYKIYIPINQITCNGIIRRLNPDLSIDEIKNMIRSPFKVLVIKRLNRKILNENDKTIEYKPTGTLLITFEGTIPPTNLSISYLSFNVTPHIPPVTQCFKCLVYGHNKNQCRGNKKCLYCTVNHESEEEFEK